MSHSSKAQKAETQVLGQLVPGLSPSCRGFTGHLCHSLACTCLPVSNFMFSGGLPVCVCVCMSECPLSIRTPVSHTGQGPNHSLVLTCSSAKISLPNKATFTDAGGQDFISHGELATEGRHNSTHKIWLKGFLCSPSVGGLGSTCCGV